MTPPPLADEQRIAIGVTGGSLYAFADLWNMQNSGSHGSRGRYTTYCG